MQTMRRTIHAAAAAALAGAALAPAAMAAIDWRSQSYCPTPAASSSAIPLDTRLGTMAESDVCKIAGTMHLFK